MWLYERTTTYACGTVRKYRKNLPAMYEKLSKGEFTFRTTDEKLIVLKYCDKKEVFMLSTTYDHDAASTGKINRQTRMQVMKPKCILEYNKYRVSQKWRPIS
jgi:hypothetical protein